ncbi:hypothetical protein LPTSP3_g05920 [Leptospira kobayashii]|uniref:Peptidase C39-like domain-containing protein n=1 Tax=Leptospira kobayashii TaxID=1917830 RepID=A0ABM7URC9_9LEPT|nr:C39 family peptidase [Leptospira kobayashii]BDA77662.1 hypothetical protein LPTSP3_g05920 [Leptospira kobayashii]
MRNDYGFGANVDVAYENKLSKNNGTGAGLELTQNGGLTVNLNAAGGANAGSWNSQTGFQANTNFLTDQWQNKYNKDQEEKQAGLDQAEAEAKQKEAQNNEGADIIAGASRVGKKEGGAPEAPETPKDRNANGSEVVPDISDPEDNMPDPGEPENAPIKLSDKLIIKENGDFELPITKESQSSFVVNLGEKTIFGKKIIIPDPVATAKLKNNGCNVASIVSIGELNSGKDVNANQILKQGIDKGFVRRDGYVMNESGLMKLTGSTSNDRTQFTVDKDSKDRIINNLKQGNPVKVSLNNGAHFEVIHGIETIQGKQYFKVMDPGYQGDTHLDSDNWQPGRFKNDKFEGTKRSATGFYEYK